MYILACYLKESVLLIAFVAIRDSIWNPGTVTAINIFIKYKSLQLELWINSIFITKFQKKNVTQKCSVGKSKILYQ